MHWQKFCTKQWSNLTGLSLRSALGLTCPPRHLIPTYPGRYMSSFTLKQHEITVNRIHRNLPPSALYEHAILHEKDAHIAENGALVAYSGAKTGRSPKDKRVVKQGASENDIWWGPVNSPLDPRFLFRAMSGLTKPPTRRQRRSSPVSSPRTLRLMRRG